ncbi:transposase, partial [Candidatus Bipolaricaulota bacterium]|nr:transposase [Candidatus Bipolaricaulota bacterium]
QKALPEFLNHPKGIRAYLYTTNQLERLIEELKRRTKAVEVFCGPEALEKLVYLVLVQENERLLGRRLRGFAEMIVGKLPCPQTHLLRRYPPGSQSRMEGGRRKTADPDRN